MRSGEDTIAESFWTGNQSRTLDDRDWHTKKWSIPRYNVEYLVENPLSSPDMLNFAIGEDESVVYPMAGQPSKRTVVVGLGSRLHCNRT